jgi:tetratricopeptide (TPR) repeat protein
MKKAIVPQRAAPDRWIYLFLFAATLAVYSQVHDFSFLDLDDMRNVAANPQVRDGFSWGGIGWAFTSAYDSNWFPVTWLSHMLVCQVFGLDAGWHHLTNVLIHALSSVLLFAVMKRMTGRLWESAFVAFVFALHPLHVESVAWVVERKDVLFAFFWFLTMWLYLDFVEQRTIRRYLPVVGAFSLGLMSKQMIVTLPFVLLLLDLWPLKRSGLRSLVLEKLPLAALAIAASAITFFAQRSGGAVQSLQVIPFASRVSNALVTYILYLRDFVWPAKLAVFYTYPEHLPVWEVVASAAVLVAISGIIVACVKTRPYLAVGWFWYLGTLLPVIGLIQVGYQSRADRYTYVPLIGISIMLAYEWPVASERWPAIKRFVPGVAIVACSVWLVMTWIQIQYWKDGIALHQHAIAVTDRNYREHENLGVEYARRQDFRDALRELFTSVEENPNQAHALNTLASTLFLVGRKEDAIEQWNRAIRMDPDGAVLHCDVGNALIDVGKLDDAIRELNTALRLDAKMACADYGLGRVLVKRDRPGDAIPYFLETLRIEPGFTQAREALDIVRKGGK